MSLIIAAWNAQSRATLSWYGIEDRSLPLETGGTIDCFQHALRGVIITGRAVACFVTNGGYKYLEELTDKSECVGMIKVYSLDSLRLARTIELHGDVFRDFERRPLADGDGRTRGRGCVTHASEIYVPKRLVAEPAVDRTGKALIGMPGGDVVQVNLEEGNANVVFTGSSGIVSLDYDQESGMRAVGFQDGTVVVSVGE